MGTPKRVECSECKGLGVTEETAPERRRVKGKKGDVWKTIKRGSGCPKCLGVAFGPLRTH